MKENHFAMLKRIKQGNDGVEFIEYLNKLSEENYLAFKTTKGPELNEYYKGFAGCVDFILEQFRKCDQEKKVADNSTWAT